MNKPTGSKLLKLKKWLTLPEAARYLSEVCEDEVTEADVIRFALDGYLILSIFFKEITYGTPGYIVENPLPKSLLEREHVSDFYFNTLKLVEDNFAKYNFVECEERSVFQIQNKLFDLPMIGCEKLSIERQFQYLIYGPEDTFKCIDRVIVVDIKTHQYFAIKEAFDNDLNQLRGDYSLQESGEEWFEKEPIRRNPENYYPAITLPFDHILFIRPDSRRFYK